ncbi:hypothetical protein ABIB06_007665 [Bradyrhizobium sp. LB8.2]|uniref:hypothetical protein n=1 Tax=unclassified Bradyrhizobium TaxID=2631580 RepID=UPI0033922CD4
MAGCHYIADSAIVSAFRLAVHYQWDRRRAPEEPSALARRKSASEAMVCLRP